VKLKRSKKRPKATAAANDEPKAQVFSDENVEPVAQVFRSE
jgi:hypothetical protein